MINVAERVGTRRVHLGGTVGGVINVYLQIRQLSESLFTFWVGTFVRPIARVDSEKARITQRLIH